MHIREAVAVALDALRASKFAAVVTSIGLIIGSASIVLVVTVALTSKKFVISQIEAVGSNLVWAEMIKTPEKVQPLSHELTLADMDAVGAEIPGVVTVAGISDMPMTIVVEGQARPVALIGVTQGYQKIRRLIILRGRFFDQGDMESRSKVCLVTQQLAARVFGVDNPIGRDIRMGELSFTVIGVFRERTNTYGLAEMQNESVLIPLPLMEYYKGRMVLSSLYAQADSPDQVDAVERQMTQVL